MIKSRNAGIDHCKAELIFIAEDDVILREGCLEILVKRFNDLKMIGIKNLFCVAPKILSVSSSAQPQNSSQNEGSWFKLNRLTGWIYTHYGDKFVETPILPSVGLYDSRLLRKIKHDENYGRNILRSDDDLHLTARKLGLRLFYEPRAMAMHLGYKSGGNRGVGLSAFFIRGFYIWKNQIRFTSKFFRIRSIYMNFIFSLVYLIYSCFSAPLVIRRARTVSGEGTQELTSVQSFRRMYKQIFKKLSPVILKDLE